MKVNYNKSARYMKMKSLLSVESHLYLLVD